MQQEKWISDPAHSELSFKIRHLMISNVTGTIQQFEVTADTQGEDFTTANISLTADLHSISTNNEQRDKHLRGADFFDVEHYPQLKFISTGIEKIADDHFVVMGELTMKGVTKPVALQVQTGGIIRSAERGTKAGFMITVCINRSDWGISFNRVLDSGGLGLGETVTIVAEIQLAKEML